MQALTCFGCQRTLQPTSQVLHEDGRLDTYPGDLYTMVDGRPWCEGCRLVHMRECRPVATIGDPTAHDDAIHASAHAQDIRDCWYEQEHRYLPPGSRGGGGKSGRYRSRKTGGVHLQEEWA